MSLHNGLLGIFVNSTEFVSETLTTFRFMGSLTNNGRKLANFAGFYKGIQSAGAAGMWR